MTLSFPRFINLSLFGVCPSKSDPKWTMSLLKGGTTPDEYLPPE